MNIKRLYILLTSFAISILLGSVAFIYIDGQSTIENERESSVQSVEENRAFIDFVTSYKTYIATIYNSNKEVDRLYGNYRDAYLSVGFLQSTNVERLNSSASSLTSLFKLEILLKEKSKEVSRNVFKSRKELEELLANEILLRMQKGEEFLPGLKEKLGSWGKGIPLFKKLRNSIDVSYVNKEKFLELHNLLKLSKILAKKDSLPESLDLKSYEFSKELKSRIHISLHQYSSYLSKLKSISYKYKKTSNKILRIKETLSNLLNDKIINDWQKHTTREILKSEKDKNRKHKLVIDGVTILSAIIILILLFVFLSVFPHLTKLEKKADEISKGEFSNTFENIPNNEFGRTMLAFNQMSQRITDYIELLKSEEKKKVQLTDSISRMKKLSAMEELSAKLSHEIKNPISIITFCLTDAIDFLKQGKITECEVELTKSKQTLDRLSLISKNLGTKYTKPLFDEIELSPFFEELVTMYDSWLSSEGIEIVMAEKKNIIKVKAPRLELQSAISNLIDNALEGAEKDKKIYIDYGVESENVEVTVSNKGEELVDKESIFNNFYSTKDGQGRGLGLAIVKDIVEMSNGKISYYYKEGLHNFKITLPRC
ncbi:MAG: hypothetical protein BM556_06025 [Bacteriovorax sp. MedPE-SWde]|nr:MAG: hypothetical protein BM556_06025 [Bacteriovorax sp. MedPE-SWde]